LLSGQANGQLDRQQSEQGCELDDRVHRHRRGILERVADGVADDCGVLGVTICPCSYNVAVAAYIRQAV
jgi:hypothetical protein